ncbi:hypothetical protein LY474_12225 [Myxococcus stipitatus]|uniref:hypothetical protein n=1 Tax=Myxococcus stipitatus TaxID=83455 RepID=UPI001F3A3B90|nr:hypothetical protein [Myxococcus stipitatus]MCE9668580.1 hypothetical protein [Myxococcus stipitatus]
MSNERPWRGGLSVLICLTVLLSARVEGAESAVQRQLAEAIRLYEGLEYELALKQLTKASVLPHDASEAVSISVLMGIVKAELGRWDEAREDFLAALSIQLDAPLPLRVPPKVAREFEAQRETARAAAAREREDAPTVSGTRPGASSGQPGDGSRSTLVPESTTEVSLSQEPGWAPSAKQGRGLVLAGRRVPLLSMVLLGTGVAAGGVGTVFGLSSRSHVTEARATETIKDLEAQQSKAQSSATTANVLFGTAAVAAVGAVTTWLVMGAPTESDVAPVLAEQRP